MLVSLWASLQRCLSLLKTVTQAFFAVLNAALQAFLSPPGQAFFSATAARMQATMCV